MVKDKYKIQKGDILFEYSNSYKRIFEWEIIDIWIEKYIGGAKTIFKCRTKFNDIFLTKEFFSSDIINMYESKEDAEMRKGE